MECKMETVTVSKFKATCLSVLEDVRTRKKRVLITKRGIPLAEIIPVEPAEREMPLKGTVTFLGDIVSPVASDEWEAAK
jgi:prevent-host-death family protein